MTRDFMQEAQAQSFAEAARLEWYQQRVAAVHARVSAYDILRRHGVQLKQASDNQEEQFKCPFHGADNKPSARIHPATNESPSHAWCFVCREPRWDAIGLWRKFGGGEMSFGQALAEIEREFGIKPPEMPETLSGPARDPAYTAFLELHEVCERRLQLARPDYERHDDMLGFLTAGSVLDKVLSFVETKKLSASKAIEVLERLRERIGEKIRA